MSKLLKVLGVLSLIGGGLAVIITLKNGGLALLSMAILSGVSGVCGFALFYGMGMLLENVQELIYLAKNRSESVSKSAEKRRFKECPKCGELNSEFAGGCIACSESLINAKIVER